MNEGPMDRFLLRGSRRITVKWRGRGSTDGVEVPAKIWKFLTSPPSSVICCYKN